MALGLLRKEPPVHLYRHDLESFFYILVWAAVHFDFKNKKRLPTHPALKRWDDDSIDSVRMAKTDFFHVYEDTSDTIFCHVREEFSDVLQNWIIPLWDLFYDAFKSIPRRGRRGDYDYDTLGGNSTFHKFMTAIGQEPRKEEGEEHC